MKGALRPNNAKRIHADEKSTEIGEIKDQNKLKIEKAETVLLLYLTSILQLV